MDNIQKKLGLKIKQLRIIKGLSRQQAADKLQMSVAGYGSIERGETDISITRLVLVSQIFNVDLIDLLDRNFADNSTTNDLILPTSSEKCKCMLDAQKNEIDRYKFMVDSQKKEIYNLEQQILQLYEIIDFIKKISFDPMIPTSIDSTKINSRICNNSNLSQIR